MTDNVTDEQAALLTPEQVQRAQALHVARAVLRGGGVTSPALEATDLHSLATYIVTGNDPWTGCTLDHTEHNKVIANGMVDAILIAVSRVVEPSSPLGREVLATIRDARP